MGSAGNVDLWWSAFAIRNSTATNPNVFVASPLPHCYSFARSQDYANFQYKMGSKGYVFCSQWSLARNHPVSCSGNSEGL